MSTHVPLKLCAMTSAFILFSFGLVEVVLPSIATSQLNDSVTSGYSDSYDRISNNVDYSPDVAKRILGAFGMAAGSFSFSSVLLSLLRGNRTDFSRSVALAVFFNFVCFLASVAVVAAVFGTESQKSHWTYNGGFGTFPTMEIWTCGDYKDYTYNQYFGSGLADPDLHTTCHLSQLSKWFTIVVLIMSILTTVLQALVGKYQDSNDEIATGGVRSEPEVEAINEQ